MDIGTFREETENNITGYFPADLKKLECRVETENGIFGTAKHYLVFSDQEHSEIVFPKVELDEYFRKVLGNRKHTDNVKDVVAQLAEQLIPVLREKYRASDLYCIPEEKEIPEVPQETQERAKKVYAETENIYEVENKEVLEEFIMPYGAVTEIRCVRTEDTLRNFGRLEQLADDQKSDLLLIPYEEQIIVINITDLDELNMTVQDFMEEATELWKNDSEFYGDAILVFHREQHTIEQHLLAEDSQRKEKGI